MRFLEQAYTIFPAARLVVYDLGMSSHQLGMINYFLVKYKPWYPMKSHGEYPDGYKPRALHKPSMLLNAARTLKGPIVYMDVDAVPVSHFEVPDCDVAVTMKSKDNMKFFANSPLEEYLGLLDAGVIMFGPEEKRELFIADWLLDMSKDPNPSDQKSLNKVVGRCHEWKTYNCTKNLEIGDDTVRVRILHEDDFNSSTAHPDAKILHLRVHENISD
jgi:hypothetical protein